MPYSVWKLIVLFQGNEELLKSNWSVKHAQLTKFQFIIQQFFISIVHTPYNTSQSKLIDQINSNIMRIHFQDQSIMRWKENRNINFILQFPIPASAFISNFNYFPLKIELFHSKITFQNSFFFSQLNSL